MTGAKPTREQADLAEVLELVLDKGIVVNADVAITVGETELLGIELRAAIASFETAAEYGLAFPSGTDMRRVEQASGREPLAEDEAVDLGIDASTGGERSVRAPSRRPAPTVPGDGEADEDATDEDATDEDATDADSTGTTTEHGDADDSGGAGTEAEDRSEDADTEDA